MTTLDESPSMVMLTFEDNSSKGMMYRREFSKIKTIWGSKNISTGETHTIMDWHVYVLLIIF